MLSAGTYSYHTLTTGDHYQTGRIMVTESHIVGYAGLVGDHFDIHMDDQFAIEHGFKGRIAHGLLILGMVDGLKNRAPVQIQAIASLGWSDWKFTAPIYPGDTIVAQINVTSKRPTSTEGRGIITLQFDVKNQLGQVVQQGQNALLVVM